MEKIAGNRDEYWQEVRGLCIIAVIMIHITIGNEDDFTFDYWLSYRQIINFPVAVFIFLAGYFSSEKSGLLSRMGRLIIPYLLWSSAYFIIFHLKKIDGVFNCITGYFESILLGTASGQLYFILVLIQLTLLNKLIHGIVLRKGGCVSVLSGLITPVYLVIVYILFFVTNEDLPYYDSFFPAWFSFYYLGCYMKYNKPKLNSLYLIIGVLVMLIISMWESKLIIYLTNNFHFACSQLKLSSFGYSVLFCLLLLSLHSMTNRKTFLSRIGDYSFGIYFMHIFILFSMNKIVSMINYPTWSFIIMQIVSVSSAVIISYLIISISDKKLSLRQMKYLGFK